MGQSLTEAECQGAQFGTAWGGAGTWGLPETCGCYVDQDGARYFNRLTGPCNNPDAGEKMICKPKSGTCLFLVLCPEMRCTTVEACFASLSNMQCATCTVRNACIFFLLYRGGVEISTGDSSVGNFRFSDLARNQLEEGFRSSAASCEIKIKTRRFGSYLFTTSQKVRSWIVFPGMPMFL